MSGLPALGAGTCRGEARVVRHRSLLRGGSSAGPAALMGVLSQEGDNTLLGFWFGVRVVAWWRQLAVGVLA